MAISNGAFRFDNAVSEERIRRAIDTRQVSTQVLVDNGETVVLGGVYEQTSSNTSQRVPFLGDLPYIGFLFKQEIKLNNKNELLIFVTPKILEENLGLN